MGLGPASSSCRWGGSLIAWSYWPPPGDSSLSASVPPEGLRHTKEGAEASLLSQGDQYRVSCAESHWEQKGDWLYGGGKWKTSCVALKLVPGWEFSEP